MLARTCATAFLLAAVGISACTPAPSDGPPRSTFQSPANSLSPEPANSLPRGFTTLHPLDPKTGDIGTVRIP